MNRRMIRLVLGAAFAVPVLAAFASPASAETVTLGSTLAGDYQSPGFSISAPTISAQISFDPATSPNPVVSPVDGTITGWKVKSADDGALYTLKVLRPNGPVSLVQQQLHSGFICASAVRRSGRHQHHNPDGCRFLLSGVASD
jgi:hypothetical protein